MLRPCTVTLIVLWNITKSMKKFSDNLIYIVFVYSIFRSPYESTAIISKLLNPRQEKKNVIEMEAVTRTPY